VRSPQAQAEPVSPAARGRLVERARRYLLERSAPRLQMTFFVIAAGLAGLFTSTLLRRLGLDHMGLRYGLAVTGASRHALHLQTRRKRRGRR